MSNSGVLRTEGASALLDQRRLSLALRSGASLLFAVERHLGHNGFEFFSAGPSCLWLRVPWWVSGAAGTRWAAGGASC